MMFALLISRFQSLMDGGQLSVIIDRGRMVTPLPQDRRIEIVMLPNLDIIATTQVPG